MRITSYVDVLQEEHDAHKQYYFLGTHLVYLSVRVFNAICVLLSLI